MKVEKLDMKKYLGRSIKLFLNDGDMFIFKPDELVDGSRWIGHDDEGLKREVDHDNIMFVKPNRV